MAKIFLQLRFKQFSRFLDEVGVGRGLLVLAIGIYLIYAGVYTILQGDSSLFIIIINLALVTSIHVSRKDKQFLFSIGIAPVRIFFMEYMLLSLPVLVALILAQEYYFFAILLFVLLVISWTNISIRLRGRRYRLNYNFIPIWLYEWRSGLRQNLLYLLVLMILAIVLRKEVFAVPLVLLLMALIISSFYLQPESRLMLEALHVGPRKFIWKKSAATALFFSGFALPLALLFVFYHPEKWALILYVFIASWLIILFGILFKYVVYEPGASHQNNMILISVMAVCFLIPFLSPVPIIMLLIYYGRSIRHLKYYLHDFN